MAGHDRTFVLQLSRDGGTWHNFHCRDGHQAANARAFAETGAGWSIPQSSLTPALLTERLAELLGDRDRLSHAAAQARRFGRDDAAERLAALVLELAPRIGANKRQAA